MIAKNNIFNIRAGQNWQGKTGVRKGFVEFQSREYAIRAWLILMRTYRRRGVKSIRQIVTRFAPPKENNTEAYIDYVCRQMKYNANYELEADSTYILLGIAMAAMETSTVLHYHEIANVMEKFNITLVGLTASKSD